MTSVDSPYAPVQVAPPASGWVQALKWSTVAVAGALGLVCAAICMFVAMIEYSGCFIGCDADTRNVPLGIGLAVLAAGLAAAGPAAGAAVFRSRGWYRTAWWTFCVLAVIASGWLVVAARTA